MLAIVLQSFSPWEGVSAPGLIWFRGCSFVWGRGGGLCSLAILIKDTEGIAEVFLPGCMQCCYSGGSDISLIVAYIFKPEEGPQVKNPGAFQEGHS